MLNGVLKNDWGFEGIVISDWAAVHTSVNQLRSGLDIEMGTPKPFNEFFLADALIAAVKEGNISETEISILGQELKGFDKIMVKSGKIEKLLLKFL